MKSLTIAAVITAAALGLNPNVAAAQSSSEPVHEEHVSYQEEGSWIGLAFVAPILTTSLVGLMLLRDKRDRRRF